MLYPTLSLIPIFAQFPDARLINRPPPHLVHLGTSERPEDRGSAARSRVLSVVARGSAAGEEKERERESCRVIRK